MHGIVAGDERAGIVGAGQELVTFTAWPVFVLVMVILALATTAPVGSVTVPWMFPVATVLCAHSGADIHNTDARITTYRSSFPNNVGRCEDI